MNTYSRRWAPVFRVLVSAGLIYAVLRQASVSEILGQVGRTAEHWPLLLVAFVLPGIGAVFAALRWNVLLGGLGAQASTLGLFRAILVGTFFNSFLPSTLGGDVARSWWVQKTIGSAALSMTVVILDRLIGLIGTCAVGLFAAALRPALAADLPQLWLTMLLVGVAASSIATLGSPRTAAAGRRVFALPVLRYFGAAAATAYAGLGSLRRDRARLLQAFLLSTALQAIIIIQFFVLSLALGLHITLWQMAFLVPVVTIVTLLPISINGIGLREVSLAVLGATFGLGTHDAVALAWLFLGFQMFYVLAGGLIYIIGRPAAD